MDIAAWLRGLGLEQYAPVFRDNGIDMQVLPKLTAEDLKDLGITMVGHRRILLEAIAQRKSAETQSSAAASTPLPSLPRSRGREGWGPRPNAGRSPSCSAISSARRPFRLGSILKTCVRSSAAITPASPGW